MTPRHARSIVRTLIHRCEDDIVVQRRAALDLSRPIHRARLNATVRRRQSIVAELEKVLSDLGSKPSWFGSTVVEIGTLTRRFRRWLCGQHDGDTFARCAAMASRTEAAYESALSEEMSPDLSLVLRQQYDAIAKTRTDFAYARGSC